MLDIEALLINYGLAGIVIYIFYRLCSNELKELRIRIESLTEKIDELISELKRKWP